MKGLDKWLTTPPDDGFDNWAEDVLANKISNEFYKENENWIDGIQCNDWVNKLFERDVDTNKAAKILERAFNIYIRKNEK